MMGCEDLVTVSASAQFIVSSSSKSVTILRMVTVCAIPLWHHLCISQYTMIIYQADYVCGHESDVTVSGISTLL